jgi:acyl-CoA reductase-like NAD-dependent aldehyde dehydrogenase
MQIGKPISDARDEALQRPRFQYYAGAIGKFTARPSPWLGADSTHPARAMSIVAAIVPWNFPFPLLAGPRPHPAA